jgi:hypothetical protein
LLSATDENKHRAIGFVDGFAPRGAYDPIPAFSAAMKLNPDRIFFLTTANHDLPDGEALDRAIGKSVPVHVFLIGGEKAPKAVVDLVRSTGGWYRMEKAE